MRANSNLELWIMSTVFSVRAIAVAKLPVQWSKRLWALPFFTLMVPSEAAPRKGNR
jgi:hypothetical protein